MALAGFLPPSSNKSGSSLVKVTVKAADLKKIKTPKEQTTISAITKAFKKSEISGKSGALVKSGKGSGIVRSEKGGALVRNEEEKTEKQTTRVTSKVIKLRDMFRNRYAFDKKKNNKERIEKNRAEKNEKEKEQEGKKKKFNIGKLGSLMPKMGILDAIQNFLFYTILGYLNNRFDILPKLVGLLPLLDTAMNFIVNIGGVILNGLVTFIDFGYGLEDKTRGFIKDIGGENAAKAFDKFSGVLDTVLNLAFIAAMINAGGGLGGPDRKPKGPTGPKGGPGGGPGRGGVPSAPGKPGTRTRSGGGPQGKPNIRNPLRPRAPITGSGGAGFFGKIKGAASGFGKSVATKFISPIINVALPKIPPKVRTKIASAVVSKGLGRFLPFVNTVLGTVEGSSRLMRGDTEGALISFASAIPVAGWGFMALDIYRDVDPEGYTKNIRKGMTSEDMDKSLKESMSYANSLPPNAAFSSGGMIGKGSKVETPYAYASGGFMGGLSSMMGGVLNRISLPKFRLPSIDIGSMGNNVSKGLSGFFAFFGGKGADGKPATVDNPPPYLEALKKLTEQAGKVPLIGGAMVAALQLAAGSKVDRNVIMGTASQLASFSKLDAFKGISSSISKLSILNQFASGGQVSSTIVSRSSMDDRTSMMNLTSYLNREVQHLELKMKMDDDDDDDGGGGGGGGGGDPDNPDGNRNYGSAGVQAVKNFGTTHGYSPEFTAGLLATIEKESGFNPYAIGDSGNSYGLFQFNVASGDRRTPFLNFLEKNGIANPQELFLNPSSQRAKNQKNKVFNLTLEYMMMKEQGKQLVRDYKNSNDLVTIMGGFEDIEEYEGSQRNLPRNQRNNTKYKARLQAARDYLKAGVTGTVAPPAPITVTRFKLGKIPKAESISGIDKSGEPGFDITWNGQNNIAVLPGRVIEKGILYGADGYGNVVVVRSVDPVTNKEVDVLYAHFPTGGIAVNVGQNVKTGEVLGRMGKEGEPGIGNINGQHASIDFYMPNSKPGQVTGKYTRWRQLSNEIISASNSGKNPSTWPKPSNPDPTQAGSIPTQNSVVAALVKKGSVPFVYNGENFFFKMKSNGTMNVFRSKNILGYQEPIDISPGKNKKLLDAIDIKINSMYPDQGGISQTRVAIKDPAPTPISTAPSPSSNGVVYSFKVGGMAPGFPEEIYTEREGGKYFKNGKPLSKDLYDAIKENHDPYGGAKRGGGLIGMQGGGLIGMLGRGLIGMQGGGGVNELTMEERAQRAHGTAVRIETAGNPGSGVLVKNNNGEYTVLTSGHVINNSRMGEEMTIITSDGKRHIIKRSDKNTQRMEKTDMGSLTFSSKNNYPVAERGDPTKVKPGDSTFVGGFPINPKTGLQDSTLRFSTGKSINPTHNYEASQLKGFTQAYSNQTQGGMSGGAVYNAQGQVIGIHGMGSMEGVQQGSRAVPIDQYTGQFGSTARVKPRPNSNLSVVKLTEKQESQDEKTAITGGANIPDYGSPGRGDQYLVGPGSETGKRLNQGFKGGGHIGKNTRTLYNGINESASYDQPGMMIMIQPMIMPAPSQPSMSGRASMSKITFTGGSIDNVNPVASRG